MSVCKMGAKHQFFIRAFLAITLIAFATTVNANGQTDKATSFIRSMTDQAITLLSDGTLAAQDRKEDFRDLLRRGFAVRLMGRYAVGPNWRRMSPEQRQKYLDLFVEFALNAYADKLSGYSGESVEILKAVTSDVGDILVRTKIVSTDGKRPLNCDWRVRSIDGEMRVIDIIVEGLSLLITQRAEFSAVIRKQGVDGLFELLRQRVPERANQRVAIAS